MPRLSVLMPAYNAAETITGAIRSTLRVLPSDAELVVVDDGSVDDTAARIAQFRTVRLIRQPNAGVAAALQRLLDDTDSQFVARMDADDLCLPGRFTRGLRALEGGAGADLAFTTVASWTPRRPPRPPAPKPVSVGEFPYVLLLTNPVAHSTMIARRSALTAVGGYRDLPTEDYDLWLRAAAAGARMRRLAVPRLLYRVHPSQVTASEQWRLSSWRNEEIAESYAALATRLLGRPARRFTALSVDETLSAEDVRAEVASFADAFTAATAHLAALQRRALARALAARREWIEGRLAAREEVGS